MTASSSDRALAPTLAGVFLAALLARLAWQLAGTPVDWPDTAIYIADGNSLFAHGRMSSTLYMPLYPILIHLFGSHGILWLQALLSAATAALAAAIAFRLFGTRAAAAAAGLLVAMHPVLIFYAGMRLSETLFTFLLSAALAAFYARRWWLGSLALVLGILTRPAIDLVAPLLVLSFALVHGERLTWRLAARRLGGYAIVYVALMTPWWIHNERVYGSFVRLNLGDGLVMRLENNPTFDKLGLDFAAFKSVLDFDDIKDPVAANEARKAAAYAYIADAPSHYLVRCLERLGRFWTPLPRASSPARDLLAFAATVPIFLGAFLCLARAQGRWRQLLPLLLLGLFLSALHATTHALPRYRVPLEPLLAVLAAGWYGPLVERLGRQRTFRAIRAAFNATFARSPR